MAQITDEQSRTSESTEQVNKPRRTVEFSKLILGLVLATYFVGISIGAWVVVARAPEQLGVYLAYIGGPTAVAIGFYAWKAKAENLIKLGQPVALANEQGYYHQGSYGYSGYGQQAYGAGPYIDP